MSTDIVQYEGNGRRNTHQNVPNEIFFATISPAEEVREDQTNPSIIGRAFSRDSQLRCSVVLIVDGIMFLLLMTSVILIGLATGSNLLKPRYDVQVICAGIGLGIILIATGCSGICAARTRKTLHAKVCAVLSLLSSASLFICFIVVVTMFHLITDKHWDGQGADFAVLTISIAAFIVGITVGIIQTMVQFRILMCFSKEKIDVTSGDIDHTTAPMLLISDDEKQLALTQKREVHTD